MLIVYGDRKFNSEHFCQIYCLTGPCIMGTSLRILLPLLLFYFFKVSLAQEVQNVVTYTTKPVEELECHFTSSSLTVVWSEQQDSGTVVLFSYGSAEEIVRKETNDTKYNNFDYHIDQDTKRFNLLIKNVDNDDSGRYVCTPFLATTVDYVVSVEVLPASISLNCTNLNGCSSSAEMEVSSQIVCICMATGISSEMVEIEWKGVSSLSTRNTKRDIDSTTGTISISSETTLPPPNEGSSLSCSLTGYESQIPESLRSSIYTFTPPVCNLLTKECLPDGKSASLICNCSDGSPEINAYKFYNSDKAAIDTQVSSEKEDANRIETFYCSGCNGVMHNPKFVEPEVKCQQGSIPLILIIVILIIVIIVVAAIVFFFKKNKHTKVRNCCSHSGDKGYVNVPMPKPEDANKGLQLSSNVQTQENKEANKKKDKGLPSSNIPPQENKKTEDDKQEKNGSTGDPENDGKEVAVETGEANTIVEPSTHERTQGDGEENQNVSENINRSCPVPCAGSFAETSARLCSKLLTTDSQEDNHGANNDSAAKQNITVPKILSGCIAADIGPPNVGALQI